MLRLLPPAWWPGLAGLLGQAAANLGKPNQSNGATPPAKVPNNQRVYAVGDIHGRADLLTELSHLILTDAAGYAGQVHVVLLGDYLNRGPHSAQVLELLAHRLDLPESWHLTFLRGNHEQALLDFLADPEGRPEWLFWGGTETLASYGLRPFDSHARLRPSAALAAELKHELTRRQHAALLHSTRLHHTLGDYLFVHAGVRPHIPLPRQLATDLMFIREDWLSQPHGLPYRVVFGHTIVPRPLITPDRVGLDTGAYQSGVLTAAVFEDTTLRLLHTTPH